MPNNTKTLTEYLAQRRLCLAALVPVLLVHIARTHAALAHTILGYVALVARLPANHTLRLQLAVLAAQAGRTLCLHLQFARDAIAAGVLLALLEAAAVALFVLLDHLVAAVASHLQLVRLVQQAKTVADAQRIDVVLSAALAELVRLHVLQSDNRLGHDAAVPVATVALLACVFGGQ